MELRNCLGGMVFPIAVAIVVPPIQGEASTVSSEAFAELNFTVDTSANISKRSFAYDIYSEDVPGLDGNGISFGSGSFSGSMSGGVDDGFITSSGSSSAEFPSETASSGSAFYENYHGVGFILENIGNTEGTVDIILDWSISASTDWTDGSPLLAVGAAAIFADFRENPTIIDQRFNVNYFGAEILEEGVGVETRNGELNSLFNAIVGPDEIGATNSSSFLFTIPAGETAGFTFGTAAASYVSTVPVPAPFSLILGSFGFLAAIRLRKRSRRRFFV